MLGLQEDSQPFVCTDLMEHVPIEIFVTHDFLVGEFVECLFHPVELRSNSSYIVSHPRLSRSWPSSESTGSAVGSSPSPLPSNGRVLLVESRVVIEHGAGWVCADQAVEHSPSGGQCIAWVDASMRA